MKIPFLNAARFRWHASRHALHTHRLTATIAGLPKDPQTGKLSDAAQLTRLGYALWYGGELANQAVAAGVSPIAPAAPTPHPRPTPPGMPSWMGWIQTAILIGVLACVMPTHFQGCAIHWPLPIPTPGPGPRPPVPPPPPAPVDPLTQALQVAYTADTAPDKAASLALLQQIWIQAVAVAHDTTLKTTGDLLTILHAAANTVLADKLPAMRQVIAAEADKALPTNPAQPLDAPTRARCQQEFTKIANALKGVKP